MSSIPGWVLDSKLEIHSHGKYETVHAYYGQEFSSQRPIKKLEHWQREKKISSGGFGEVWLERCTKGKHGHQVRATKEMEYERCFVTSFGWYQTQTSLFIAMEYLELGDLHNYLLKKKQPLPELEARSIMSQILEGLDLMHGNDFVHRDLKPKNILLRSCPPDDWWVKIADFGISKCIEDGLEQSTTMNGTMGYIAPELHKLTERGTPYAADIWAAGEVMFQILTKQPTFEHLGLLSNYVQTPNIFPCNKLLANRVSLLGVEFVLCLMDPIPARRMSARNALQHRWICQSLPNNRSSDTLAYKEAHTTSSLDSMTERFASWNTVKYTGAFETSIAGEKQELGKSSLQTSSNATVKSQPVQSATAVRTMLPRALKGHSKLVTCVTFSPDGKLVASGSNDLTVILWNTTTGSIHTTLKGHSSRVTSVAFSSNGKLVVSGSQNRTVIVWNTTTGAIHTTLEGHSSWVTSLAFSPDGKLLASVSDDLAVNLWDTTTGTIHKTLEDPSSSFYSLAFSPDGKLLASVCCSYVILWDTTTGTRHRILENHSSSVDSVAFSSDGKLVAFAYFSKIELWDTTTGTRLKTLEFDTYRVQSVAFSPDDRLLASGSNENTVRLWDTTMGVIYKTFGGHSSSITSVVFSPDGKLAASGSTDKTVRLWDASF
ncbi:hypothetical protein N7447_009579 [Penicillium robsamsonii]|uniref:uncharacterized protein n=1 Tax=Penicillium robsamsonii TaxID=1792511 RepID=UPI00254839E3|nr:uncharacterized protein N7447_009579 [Penicillium robsamsonii]KAJ5817346.1 hypothetical protein N7447_009579 [Penicillium robsamsonii]